MNSLPKTSEVLDLAADEIQRRGHAKGGTGGVTDPWGQRNGTGPVCIEGALVAAAGMNLCTTIFAGMQVIEDSEYAKLEACPAYQSVREYLNFHQPLYRWNDAKERTAFQVVATLRAAAAVERTREAVAVAS